ncbi:MAG: apolipoprotein N-acyltransferase [Pseudomonadota bacterium]
MTGADEGAAHADAYGGVEPAGVTGWLARQPLFVSMALAFGAGLVSALAFAPTHLAPALFLTLPALLILMRGAASGLVTQDAGDAVTAPDGNSLRRAFLTAWAFGFGLHLVGLHWIGNAFLVQADVFAWALPFAVTLMPAALALFWGFAGLVIAIVPATRVAPWLTFALAVAGIEWLRSVIFTGFPWNVIGYALAWPVELMQLLSVVGVHGATLLAVVIALLPIVMWRWLENSNACRAWPRWQLAGLTGLAGALPVVLLAIFGAVRLATASVDPVPGVKVRIVQPSIDQRRKWRPDAQRAIFEEHLALTAQESLAGITHIFWAEAAMPFRPLEVQGLAGRLATVIPDNSYLVAGILRRGDRPDATDGLVPVDRPVYNSAAVFDRAGRAIGLYDKIHLVPFGEYLPFPGFLSAIGFETLVRQRGGFTPGPRPRRPMLIPGLPPLEMLICYEAIFPHEVARGRARPSLLVNLTNDGWFGTLSGPYQHVLQTRARAVEYGLPLIRVSNNGVSGIVDPYGRMSSQLDLNVIGFVDGGIVMPLEPTLYARVGDSLAAGLALIILMIGIAMRAKTTSFSVKSRFDD